MAKKKEAHRILKTHKSHKWLIGIILIVVVLMGYQLWKTTRSANLLSDSEFRYLTVSLLFSLNMVMILFVIIVTTFIIELKDKYFKD